MGLNFHAASDYNTRHASDITPGTDFFAELVASFQDLHGLEIDGGFGPKTRAAVQALLTPAAPAQPLVPPLVWNPWDGPLTKRPHNRAEVIAQFGHPGKKKLDDAWEKKNIVELHGDDRILEIPEKFYFKCHRDVAPYMREAFRRAHLSAPDYVIVKAASFVYRHMRHDEDMPLSDHSWGIAVDVNSDDNDSETFDAGKTPKPWSDAWRKRWPKGLPKAFVDAFTSCGFSWGGYWTGFVDPMHFAFVGQKDVQV